MSIAQTVEVLRRTPLFRRMDDLRLRVIAMSGELLVLRTGERLAEQGEEGDAAFIILSGEADILAAGQEGEVSVAILGPTEIVGEMAVLTGNPRASSIVAKGDLRVLRIERDTILDLLREFPDLALEFIRILAQRLEATNARIV